jgi:hypothetical protein
MRIFHSSIMAATEATRFSYDALLHVLDIVSSDYHALYQCSLVNWEFNRAASRLLYARIKLSPPFQRAIYLKSRAALIYVCLGWASALWPLFMIQIVVHRQGQAFVDGHVYIGKCSSQCISSHRARDQR